MYIRLNDHEVDDTDAVTDDFILDFDSEGNVIGIELLDASVQLSAPPTQVELKLLIGLPRRVKDR